MNFRIGRDSEEEELELGRISNQELSSQHPYSIESSDFESVDWPLQVGPAVAQHR